MGDFRLQHSVSVVHSWFMRGFSMVWFYMLKLMTLFGFPWTHLYSCLLVENGCEAFSLAHSRSSVGGGLLLMLVSLLSIAPCGNSDTSNAGVQHC